MSGLAMIVLAVAAMALAGMALFWALGGWGLVVLFVAVPAYGVYRANRSK